PDDFETSNTIYIATGDRDGWDNRSIGVLKSTDRGNTWNSTGLSFTIYEGQMVNRLLIDPTNNQILIAATTRGVFKTLDGGTNWSLQMTSIEFIDLEFNPLNPNIIYGSTKYGEIHLSTDATTFSGPVYSDGNARRVELAVSPNQPSWVYAVASNGESGLYGIFQSTDNGNSFVEVFSGSTKNLLTWESDGSGTGGQGWYDLCLAASPFDANVLLVGGVNTWRSIDGGANWSIVNHWWGDQVQSVHADKHRLAFRANGDLFECNDGGVYHSTDNGSNWSDRTHGIQISQMYRLGVSQTGPEDIMTGLQDNGSKLHSGSNWFDVMGGDGMECLIDYSDVNIQYGTVYFGSLERTNNHWMNSTNITPPDDGAWVTPYIIDPSNPNILYGGYNEVWKTEDRGDNWAPISEIDPDGQILSMGISTSDPSHLYVADYNTIYKTTTGGGEWNDITSNLPVANANIEYITVKHDDPNTIWVALSGYTNPGIYVSIDGGLNWTSISVGLPPIPVTSVVQNKQKTDVVHLYAGTELGVYFKRGDEDWVPYNIGLPNVRIGEIEIYYAGNPGESKLRAATYGRGLWETPIEYTPTLMSYVSSSSAHPNKKQVAPDQVNQEILRVEISTTGNLNPFGVTSFTFNTEGSTDALNDISNARLFYSGSSNTFSTDNQFGDVVVAPNGEFSIVGFQELNDGRNNFWLAYDLPATATLGHVLDAECTSVIVDSVRSLVITAPEGNRTIGFEYCSAGAAQMDYEYISNFKMGSVDQPSGKGAGGYEDYTHQVIDMVIGQDLEFDLTNGVPYASDEVLIWVDWNIDGDFNDPEEFVFASGPSGEDHFLGAFAPPSFAKLEKTKMRVRLHDRDNGPNETACDFSTWGEVEDYSVLVTLSPPVAGIAGSDLVLCAGWYGEIRVQEFNGSIQWQESPDGVNNWENVTSGIGPNSDIYTTPPLFSTTFYRAEVTQPTFAPVYTNNVWIIVMPTPGDAGPITGESSVCQGDEGVIYTVDEIENAQRYYWILPEGATGVSDSNTIHVTFSSSAVSGDVSVAGNIGGCLGSTSFLTITVNAKPLTPQITYSESENTLHSDSPSGNQWYDQNGIIDGATAQDYQVTTDGNFYVIVTENGCTSDPSNVIQVLISSVEIAGKSYQVKVNPNPVKEQMIVEIPGNSLLIPFEINNISGQSLIRGEISDRTVVLTDKLLPGVYFLQLKGDGFVKTKKFVKE
ncbi:MAG TPA: GEVED domain-containing protein, partial [Saprospiraceae bacterium]